MKCAKGVDDMDNPRLVMLGILALIIVAVGIWVFVKSKRRERLRAQFGPEYPRAVEKYGSVTRAESALEARRARVRRLDIRPLQPRDAERFAVAWRAAQAQFVEDPRAAITEADALVQDLMQSRGYPVGDFEERVADISVDHAPVAEHYRTAHAIALASGRPSRSASSMSHAARSRTRTASWRRR